MASDRVREERVLVRALRKAAGERGIACETFSSDWIVRLTRGSDRRYVFGYNFDLNSATAVLIANDKSAVSTVLEADRVPHVEHRLFLHPRMADYVSSDGNWAAALTFAEDRDYRVVCKPNVGAGGSDVIRAKSRRELEAGFQRILARGYSVALAPLYEVVAEYRTIILDGRCLLSYEKRLPSITGDGSSTVGQLIAVASAQVSAAAARALKESLPDVTRVPARGEVVRLAWKHNLGGGADAVEIADPGIRDAACDLARRAAQAIGIRCAAVDVITTESEMLVLEVNAGIMLEHYARRDGSRLATTERVYGEILDTMFAFE